MTRPSPNMLDVAVLDYQMRKDGVILPAHARLGTQGIPAKGKPSGNSIPNSSYTRTTVSTDFTYELPCCVGIHPLGLYTHMCTYKHVAAEYGISAVELKHAVKTKQAQQEALYYDMYWKTLEALRLEMLMHLAGVPTLDKNGIELRDTLERDGMTHPQATQAALILTWQEELR